MVRTVLLSLGLVACGGPVEETLVDELRVVAAIPSTPEARPGERIDVDVTIIEPDGAPVDVMVWLCTASGPPGAPCLEDGFDRSTSMVVQRGVTGDVAASLELSPALAGVLSDSVLEIPTSLWVLTCEPDVCPIMDASGEELAAALADPAALLRELPLQGVAASRRTVRVSNRSDDERNQNPTLFGVVGESQVAPEAEVTFTLDVRDDQPGGTAYGYATAGGFSAVEAPVIDGKVELVWFAPEGEPVGPVQLLVVVQDGLGGEGLWRAGISVEAVR